MPVKPIRGKTILILARGGLGDSIRFLSVLRPLRDNFPSGRILIVVKNQIQKDIFLSSGLGDEIAVYSPESLNWSGKLSFWRYLRRQNPDILIATYQNIGLYTKLFSLFSCIPIRVGYCPRPFFNRPIRFRRDLPRIEIEGEILKRLRLPASDLKPFTSFDIPSAAHRYADLWLREKGIDLKKNILIGLHIGLDEISHGKCWPLRKYLELIGRIAARFPAVRFLILGGEDEVSLQARLRELSFPPEAETVIGEADYFQSSALLSRCSLFISNDGFLMHLAAGLKLPVIALFGPTAEKVVVPPCGKIEVVSLDLPCRPCYRMGAPGERKYGCDSYHCIRDIPVEEVMRAVLRWKTLLEGGMDDA
jgi:ADP-heptose:LPS heptosyltransferase